MKTRSNMPLFVLEVDNVKTLSNSQIDLLRCGDYLVKKDASGEHAYKVTFKSATGMCITYFDASVIETQSYDKVGDNWVYNSEDKQEITDAHFQNLMEQGEPMEGYEVLNVSSGDGENDVITPIYLGLVKNGKKLTIVYYFAFEKIATRGQFAIAQIKVPADVHNKLYPDASEVIAYTSVYGAETSISGANTPMYLDKLSNNRVQIAMYDGGFTNGKTYKCRYEQTLLLSDNLIPE